MLKRTHQKDDAASVAIYSDCERYRYTPLVTPLTYEGLLDDLINIDAG